MNETVAQCMAVGKIAGSNGDSAADFGVSAMLACKAAEIFTEFTRNSPTMFTVKNWDAAKAEKPRRAGSGGRSRKELGVVAAPASRSATARLADGRLALPSR